jgi:hypothetical protein
LRERLRHLVDGSAGAVPAWIGELLGVRALDARAPVRDRGATFPSSRARQVAREIRLLVAREQARPTRARP